jgi:DNA-binding transcriptional ArsR family regulator
MPDPLPIEVHKALADDTRYRLYRYLRLSGRPVAIRELATRLSLHPNTLRPHLRRLEEVGLVASEQRKGPSVGRPQTLYLAVDAEPRDRRDHQLLADILAGLLTGARQRDRAQESPASGCLPGRPVGPATRGVAFAAPTWPCSRGVVGAGFTPRFRRRAHGPSRSRCGLSLP